MLITFSGLDGSGKTTQIANLRSVLASLGQRTTVLTFWDNVVVGARYREGFVHRVYKSERGVGAPGRPVVRRDKNVRRWYLTVVRHFLYLLDALHLCWVVAQARRSDHGNDVVIFDRYIYDELANLPLSNRFTRAFVRLVVAIVPRPDVAYLLDVDPEAAVRRKPEYPLEFMRSCRAAYMDLARELWTMTVIPISPLPQARKAVVDALFVALAERKRVEENRDLQPAA
jgi:thymidylate kinase